MLKSESINFWFTLRLTEIFLSVSNDSELFTFIFCRYFLSILEVLTFLKSACSTLVVDQRQIKMKHRVLQQFSLNRHGDRSVDFISMRKPTIFFHYLQMVPKQWT